MPINRAAMKLGKNPAVVVPSMPKLSRYVIGLPLPLPLVRNSRGIKQWGTMLNETLGDCTIAAVGHAEQVWKLSQMREGQNAVGMLTDGTILGYYEKWCGYDPENPGSDQGGVMIHILRDLLAEGFSGNKISAYAALNYGDPDEVKLAIELFGGVYLGIQLPVSAQSQDEWEVEMGSGGDPGSWGGHCVFVPDYDFTIPAKPELTCISWGEPVVMTWEFLQKYADEAYCIIADDWKCPEGFALDVLQADLKSMGRL